jgi:hypothetical protein
MNSMDSVAAHRTESNAMIKLPYYTWRKLKLGKMSSVRWKPVNRLSALETPCSLSLGTLDPVELME